MENIEVICFGGNDWWYHNRGHIDMQLARRFAKKGPTLYINSIVMQKLNLNNRKDFMARLVRKTKRQSDTGSEKCHRLRPLTRMT